MSTWLILSPPSRPSSDLSFSMRNILATLLNITTQNPLGLGSLYSPDFFFHNIYNLLIYYRLLFSVVFCLFPLDCRLHEGRNFCFVHLLLLSHRSLLEMSTLSMRIGLPYYSYAPVLGNYLFSALFLSTVLIAI